MSEDWALGESGGIKTGLEEKTDKQPGDIQCGISDLKRKRDRRWGGYLPYLEHTPNKQQSQRLLQEKKEHARPISLPCPSA